MNWNEVDLDKLVVNDLSTEEQLSLRDYLINIDKEKRKEWYKENSKYRNELKAKKYKENPKFKKDVYRRASETKTGMHYNMTEEEKKAKNKKVSDSYQNKTEEEKRLHMQKVSISQKIRYSKFTEEDKKRNSQIHRDCLINRTPEEKLQTSLKLSQAWHNKPEEEKRLINNKRVKSTKKTWSKKSIEEVREIFTNHVKSAKSSVANDGRRLDSSYEKHLYNYFLNRGFKLERNIPIDYIIDDYNRVTFIDFKFNNILLECKGYHLLKGIFSRSSGIPIDIKLKIYEENNVVLVTDKSGLDYCKENNIHLNVLTIDLFKNNFPLEDILDIIKRGGLNAIQM